MKAEVNTFTLVPCPCKLYVIWGGKLKRNMRRVHKDHPDIKDALFLPKGQQDQFFEQKGVDGMYEYNLKILANPAFSSEKKLMRQRIPKIWTA